MNTIRIALDHDRNRDRLADWLDEIYRTEAGPASPLDDGVDLCLVDPPAFRRHRDAIQDWKRRADPVFAPVLLVTAERVDEAFDPSSWQTIDGLYVVDDVVSTPLEQAVLHRRIENLLERRTLSQRLQRRYRQSEGRFDSLFAALPDPAMVVSGSTVRYANDALADLCGRDESEIVGSSLGSAFPMADDALATLRDCIERARDSGAIETADVTAETDDGERHLSIRARDVMVDETSGVCVLARDVTERVARERLLTESEARFRQIAASVEETIWMLDADTQELLYASPGYEDLTGRSRAALESDPVGAFLDGVHEDDADGVRATIRDFLDRVAAGATDAELHEACRYRRRDGAVRWFQLDASVVPDGAGDPHRLVGIIDDVTDLKRRQRELARQNERLEEFTAIVSHDLRNPLQVIGARAAALREEVGENDHLDSIEGAADRMAELLDDLLTLATEGDTAEREPTAVDDVAGAAWAQVNTPEATLDVETDVVVSADPGRLQQLFENLFRNAVEHAGPDVTVTVGDLADGVGFYVADDGPGIPADGRERVFESGYTTTDEGTGLGLNIVADVAADHGWTVDVTESAAGGARFEISDVRLG